MSFEQNEFKHNVQVQLFIRVERRDCSCSFLGMSTFTVIKKKIITITALYVATI